MNFQLFGNKEAPTMLLIPCLGVSYEIFLPFIRLTEDKYHIIAAEVDGVTPQFEGHKECAVFMGNTPEQVAELCRWLEKHIK